MTAVSSSRRSSPAGPGPVVQAAPLFAGRAASVQPESNQHMSSARRKSTVGPLPINIGVDGARSGKVHRYRTP